MILYKYLRADYAMQAIETKRLKVSQFGQLNDIYDSRPKIIYDGSSHPDKNQGFEEELTSKIALRFGINCYCRTATNLLVWSHYGDSHRGVALGFELDEGIANSSELGLRIIREVIYPPENARAEVIYQSDIAPLTIGDQLLAILQKGYSVKGVDWSYEYEYREFLLLRECVPSGTLYFSPFRPGSLRQVILGERCTLSPQYVLDLVVHSKRNSVGYRTDVLRARSLEDSFSMKNRKPF